MRREQSVLAQGMHQQPQQTTTPVKQAREDMRARINPFHFPKMSVIHFSMGLLIPESSFICRERARRPSKARVTDRGVGV